jgi:hypothetical protein
MRHLIVLNFTDNASAQAVRTALQQAEPSQLTILAEETLAPLEQPAASKLSFSMPFLVRVPLAIFVGFFAGAYYGAKWLSETVRVVSNYLSESQANTNGQTPRGRVVLLIDEALSETFVNKLKQLGAGVQQVDLSAKEEERLWSQHPGQPAEPQAAATTG